ncbi:MAG TPA: hypothetical protein VEX38_09160 [Fimbriimonadaceae bacterium]|nr:hypothetical protein [Fimbriimonadaceae bacterium]
MGDIHKLIEEALMIAAPRGMKLNHISGLLLRARFRFAQWQEAIQENGAPSDEPSTRRLSRSGEGDIGQALYLARECQLLSGQQTCLTLITAIEMSLGNNDSSQRFQHELEEIKEQLNREKKAAVSIEMAYDSSLKANPRRLRRAK